MYVQVKAIEKVKGHVLSSKQLESTGTSFCVKTMEISMLKWLS